MRRIVAAAVTFDGLIITAPPPARHHTLINGASRLGFRPLFGPECQGFLTDDGKFVNRREAMFIARTNDQILFARQAMVGDELFSEDVW